MLNLESLLTNITTSLGITSSSYYSLINVHDTALVKPLSSAVYAADRYSINLYHQLYNAKYLVSGIESTGYAAVKTNASTGAGVYQNWRIALGSSKYINIGVYQTSITFTATTSAGTGYATSKNSSTTYYPVHYGTGSVTLGNFTSSVYGTAPMVFCGLNGSEAYGDNGLLNVRVDSYTISNSGLSLSLVYNRVNASTSTKTYYVTYLVIGSVV